MSGYPSIPQAEPAIYVESLQRGDHYHYDDSNSTAAERRPIVAFDCWIQADQIPSTPPARTPWPGTASGIVTGISGVTLTMVPGNEYRYAWQGAPPQRFEYMVPANYFDRAYEPRLTDATGVIIPYNPSVWVADGVLSVVEFKRSTPTELGYRLPLSLAYWRYDGTFPTDAGSSAIDTIVNVGNPGGDIWESTAAGIANLRRVEPDPTAGREGIIVSTVAQNVRVGNTLTGANPSATPGADVFINRTGAALNFRTLVAGPNVSITEGIPTANDITIAADGSSGAPDNLDLYVSALGNDVTGNGTAGNPYLTLGRAFLDIRGIGYNETAVVTIQSAGGPFTLPTGLLALNQGSHGAHRTPVEVRGDRSVVSAGLVVTAVTTDPVSGFHTIDVGAAPGFALGQIVSFTSGASAGQEMFIASDLSPTSVRLPHSLTTPAPGDTFDLLALDTVVEYDRVGVEGFGEYLVLRDLKFETAATPVAQFTALNTLLLAFGVWWENNATSSLIDVYEGVLQAGGNMPDAASIAVPSSLGAYFDNTAPGGTLIVSSPFKSRLAGTVVRGNGATGNSLLLGEFPSISDSYFSGIGSVRVTQGTMSGAHIWFETNAPENASVTSVGAVFEVTSNAAASLDFARVAGSTQRGLAAALDGELTLGDTVAVSGTVVAAVYAARGGHVIATGLSPALSSNSGFGYHLYDHGRLTATGDLNVVAASIANAGFRAEGSSTADVGSFTAGSTPGGLILLASSLQAAGDVTANGCTGINISLADHARLTAGGNLTANGSSGAGLSATQSEIAIIGAVSASTNASVGLTLVESVMRVSSSVIASDNLVSNISMSTGAHLLVGVAVTANSAGSVGIDLSTGARIVAVSGIAATLNTETNIAMATGAEIVTSTVDASTSTNNIGISMSDSTVRASGIVTADSNAQTNIEMRSGSLMTASQVSATTGGSGISMFESTLRAGGAIDAGGNGGTNVYVNMASTLSVEGVIAASASTTGRGISIEGNSSVRVDGPLTASSNAGVGQFGIELSSGATLVAGSIVADANTAGLSATQSTIHVIGGVLVTGSTAAPGIILTDASMRVGDAFESSGNNQDNVVLTRALLSASGAADTSASTLGDGILAVDSDIMLADSLLSENNVAGSGVNATGSRINIGAAAELSDNGASGLVLSATTMWVASVGISTDANAADNIVLTNSSVLTVSGTVAATSSGGVGLSMTNSTLRATSTLSATGNTGGNVVARRATLSVVGAADTGSAATSTGLSASQSDLYFGSTLTSSSNPSSGISLTQSTLRAVGAIVASSNASTNIIASQGSRIVSTAGVTAGSAGVGAGGIDLASGSSIICTAMSVTLNDATNILMTSGSEIICTTLDASGSVAGSGIDASASTIRASGAVTVTNSGGVPDAGTLLLGCNIALTERSLFIAALTVNVSSSVDNAGIHLRDAVLRAFGAITASLNGRINIELRGASTLTCFSNITANQSPNSAGMLMDSGTVVRANGTVTTSTNTSDGIIMGSGAALIAATLTAVGNAARGIQGAFSTVIVGGAVTVTGSGAGGGIDLTDSRMQVLTTLTATGNTGGNVILTRSTLAVTGAANTGSAASLTGLSATQSDLLFGSTLTSSSNPGTGISLTQSILRCIGLITSSSNVNTNIIAVQGTRIVCGAGVTTAGASSVGANGISLATGSSIVCTAVSATLNNATNIVLASGSELVCTTLDASGGVAAGAGGISATSSTIRTTGAITTNLAGVNQGINIDLLQRALLITSSTITASSSAGGSGISLTDSVMRATGAIVASSNNQANILVRSASTLTCEVTITASSVVTGSGLQILDGSTVRATAGVTASTNNAVGTFVGIELTTGSALVAGTLTAATNRGGVSATLSSIIVLGAATITSSTVNFGLNLSNSTFRCAGILTCTGNPIANINATASTIDVSTTSASTVDSAASSGTGLLINLSKVQFVGALTASSSTGGTGINATSSEISIGGTLTASSNGAGISLIGTRLRGGDAATSITCSANTNAGLAMVAGASLSTRGAMTMVGNTGIGFSAADSQANISGLLSVTTSSSTNVSLTQTTLTVGSLVASTSTTGRGILMTEARLEADTTVVASSNNQSNLETAGSTVVVGTNATFSSSATNGILTTSGNTIIVLGTLTAASNAVRGAVLLNSDLIVGIDLTITGNTTAGLAATRSSVRVGGVATIHGTNGTNTSLISSTMAVASAVLSSAASTGIKILLQSSHFWADTTITAVTAVAGGNIGISMVRESTVTCNGLTLTGNAINLNMLASKMVAIGTNTVSNSTSTANIVASSNSQLVFGTSATTIGKTGANIANGIILTRSTLGTSGAINISGNHTIPLRVLDNSSISINGAASTISGGASTTHLIRISSSQMILFAITVSGSTGGNPNILLEHGSSGLLSTITSGTSSGAGIQVHSNSAIRMTTIAGAANATTGLLVNGGGKVTFAPGTMTITGASDCTVGVNAAKTWAQMGSGEAQHVNDFLFPAGVAVTATSVTSMSSCSPE